MAERFEGTGRGPGAPEPGRARRWIALVPAGLVLAAGVWLRLDQLGWQVPADDEWHALRAVLEHDTEDLLRHFGLSDRSIPLTLLYRFLAEWVGLDEVLLRLPQLLSGLLALVLLPLLAPRSAPAGTRIGLACLLAVAPMLVGFSRYARPYMPAALLASAALLAGLRWLEREQIRFGIALVLLGSLALWLLPPAAPLVLAPWALLLARAAGKAKYPTLIPLFGAALIFLGLCALLLGPPLLADGATLAAKTVGERAGPASLAVAGMLLAGIDQTWLLALWAAGILAGLALLARRERRPALWLGLGLLFQAAGVLASGALGLSVPIVLARYLLPALPLTLLLLAATLARVDRALNTIFRYWPHGLAAAAAAAALLAAGPLPGIHTRPNGWTNHALFQYSPRPAVNPYLAWLAPPAMPGLFYGLGHGAPVLHAPFPYMWHHNPLPFFQHAHRRPVVAGVAGKLCPGGPPEVPLDARFRFRTVVGLADLEGLRRRGVEFVVIHRAGPLGEIGTVAWSAFDARQALEWCAKAFGAPILDEGGVAVFRVGE